MRSIRLFLPILVAFLCFWHTAAAQTVCVILNPGGTAVLQPNPPCNAAGATSISTSDTRWTAYQTAQTAQQQLAAYESAYAAQIGLGLQLTSTGNSALNGTYPIADCSTNFLPLCNLVLQAQLAAILNTQVFLPAAGAAGGATTAQQADTSGNLHSFDRDHIIAWGGAIGAYINNCNYQNWLANGKAFPSNAVTIP